MSVRMAMCVKSNDSLKVIWAIAMWKWWESLNGVSFFNLILKCIYCYLYICTVKISMNSKSNCLGLNLIYSSMILLCIILPKFNFHFYKSLKVNAFQHKAEERANHSFYLHDFLFNPFMSTPLNEIVQSLALTLLCLEI